MSDTRFAYASRFEVYTTLVAFLKTAGWSIVYERQPGVNTAYAVSVLAGTSDRTLQAPPVVAIHWNPIGVGSILFQGFRNEGTLSYGTSDLFGDDIEIPIVISRPLGSQWDLDPSTITYTLTDHLVLTPEMGSWDILNTTYAFAYQPSPGNSYSIHVKGVFQTSAPAITAAAGIGIRNTGNIFVRLFLDSVAGVNQVILDTYDGAAYSPTGVVPIGYAPGSSLELRLDQFGGMIIGYYRVGAGSWTQVGTKLVNEDVFFDGNEECGLFSYSSDAAWTSNWYAFRWGNHAFGIGDPLFRGGLLSLTPAATGDCCIYADSQRFTVLEDPAAGANKLIHAGVYDDHTGTRVLDNQLCIVDPYNLRAMLYSQTTGTGKFRQGLSPETAAAALGQPMSIDGTYLVIDEQPQVRTGDFILHPYFVGIQGIEKQIAGEVRGLYRTGNGPANYDLILHRGSNYLYVDGLAIGPFAPIGGEVIYNGEIITWVDPSSIENEDDYLPSVFTVYEGAEQPQIIIEWNEPAKGWTNIDQMLIQRKLQEYPRDQTDGTNVYTGDGTVLGYSDRTVTGNEFFYYKVFITKDSQWYANEVTQGYAFSWSSNFGEELIYKRGIQAIHRQKDTVAWQMTQGAKEDSPEVLNWLEGASKGFFNRMLKNYGLEVDRIKALHRAFETAFDPERVPLCWLRHLGLNYSFEPSQTNEGLRQRQDLKDWPYLLKKKGAAAVYTIICEQVTGLTPTIIYGSDSSLRTNGHYLAQARNHTFNKGAALGGGIGYVNYTYLRKRVDDPNSYLHGYRSVYNNKGIFMYVNSTGVEASVLSELEAKLTPFVPATSILIFYVYDTTASPVTNVEAFTIKAEENYPAIK